jgi:hypothetical protein
VTQNQNQGGQGGQQGSQQDKPGQQQTQKPGQGGHQGGQNPTPASRIKTNNFIDTWHYWPAPGSEDTELGVLMGPEVRHGEAEVYARAQA